MMSTTKTQPPATTEFPPINQIGGKALDAVSVLAEANQRVVGQLIELSASAAADRLRTLGELQSAALEAARGVFTPMNPREAFEELRQDPFAWYRKGVASMLDGTQRVFKLFETNAQIVSRNTERFQGAAERTGKEIENAVSTCTSRLREIYGTRN
jgi:hypothetical protein